MVREHDSRFCRNFLCFDLFDEEVGAASRVRDCSIVQLLIWGFAERFRSTC